jgi:hypothetical protein
VAGILRDYIIITCIDLVTTLSLTLIVFTADYYDYSKILGKRPNHYIFIGFTLIGVSIVLTCFLLLLGFYKEVHGNTHAYIEVWRYVLSIIYTTSLLWIFSELTKNALKSIKLEPEINEEEFFRWLKTR